MPPALAAVALAVANGPVRPIGGEAVLRARLGVAGHALGQPAAGEVRGRGDNHANSRLGPVTAGKAARTPVAPVGELAHAERAAAAAGPRFVCVRAPAALAGGRRADLADAVLSGRAAVRSAHAPVAPRSHLRGRARAADGAVNSEKQRERDAYARYDTVSKNAIIYVYVCAAANAQSHARNRTGLRS